MPNKHLIEKITLFKSKLNIELRKKLARNYVWSIIPCGSETWILRKSERKIFEELPNVVLEENEKD